MSQTFEHTIPVRVGGVIHRTTVAYSVNWEEPAWVDFFDVTHIDNVYVTEASETLAAAIEEEILDSDTANGALLVHAKRVREAANRPAPFVPTDLVEKPIREAFGAAYRKLYGDPGRHPLTGMEGMPGLDYANPFLWIDRHPEHPEVPPAYYRSDMYAKYVLFRAGWQAHQEETDHG